MLWQIFRAEIKVFPEVILSKSVKLNANKMFRYRLLKMGFQVHYKDKTSLLSPVGMVFDGVWHGTKCNGDLIHD